jgi:MFS family permease
MPAIAVDVLMVGEEGLGVLNAAIGLGALVGSLVVASMGAFRRRGMVLVVGSVLFPVSLLLFASARSLVVAFVWLVVVGFAFMTQNATANTLVQSLVPDELRARVMAVYILCFFGTSPFAAIQAGALAQAFGPARAVGIGAAVYLAFALYMHLTTPLMRRLET